MGSPLVGRGRYVLYGACFERKDFVLKDTDMTSQHARERIWTLLWDVTDPLVEENARALAAQLHISPLVARLLCNRGYTDAKSADLFLSNDERVWHDPALMADMAPAVARTLEAVREGEPIVVYGDYDVDGVTSVTSLYLYLKSLGAQVTNYIPSRIGEGYGMSVAAVDRLAAGGTKLIITVDTGITANREIAHAAALGVDTVVTDHHECHGDLPLCAAVVNPHRPDCPYPFKELAGVGVVFKFICALEAERAGISAVEAFNRMSEQLIDLVAIGTIADVMPLTDENRFIVSRGLAMLDHTERVGLAALLDSISGSGQVKSAAGAAAPKKPRRKVNSGLVGFGIAPRINAAGRIAHAMQAVELLLCEEPEEAAVRAEALCEINTHRQVEENSIAEQAYAMIDEQLATGPRPSVIVLEDDGWMQGIVGIVSSRITEKYGIPSILISFEGAVGDEQTDDDIGKGSGRSIKGLNLVEALADSQDLLVRFGGHELAAGLTIRRADIPAFREHINRYAAEHLTDEMTAVRYEADCEVEAEELCMKTAEELERLEPFGVGNQSPLLVLRDAVVQKIIPLGAGKHTKILLYKDGQMFTAIWFSMATGKLPAVVGDEVDLLFQLNINDYQGVRNLQLIVQDMKPSARRLEESRRERVRFFEIIEGASIEATEQVVPTREDIACVFTILRQDARLGNTTVTERALTDRIEHTPTGAACPIKGIKLRLILRILEEIGVATVTEPDEGIFCFEINFDAPKTSVEASPLLQSLRGRLEA